MNPNEHRHNNRPHYILNCPHGQGSKNCSICIRHIARPATNQFRQATKKVASPAKLKPIPDFANEDEEREFWDTHDSTEYVDWSKAKRARGDELHSIVTSVVGLSHRGQLALAEAIERYTADQRRKAEREILGEGYKYYINWGKSRSIDLDEPPPCTAKKHKWESGITLDSNPPIYTSGCKICGLGQSQTAKPYGLGDVYHAGQEYWENRLAALRTVNEEQSDGA